MLQIQFNVDQVLRDLTDFQKRQVPFALASALNKVAKSRQQLLKQHIVGQLTIRNAAAKAQFGKVVQFRREDVADKKGPFVATLRVLGGNLKAQAPVLQRISSIVLRQEEKKPGLSQAVYRASGGRNAGMRMFHGGFVLPAPGLRSATKGVPRKLYPSALGLTPQRRIEGGEQFNSQYKGGRTKRGKFRKNTKFYFAVEGKGIFVREQLSATKTIHGVTPTGGRYTRTVGVSQYDSVWFFKKTVKASRRLDIDKTFTEGLDQQLGTVFNEQLEHALRTAK
jgi:hypothetical protein